MDHLHCSEKLRPYALAELDAPETEAVERHLDTCEDCREELAGLRALTGGDPAGLSEIEQKKLHSAVAKATGPREPIVLGAGLTKKNDWARRFAPTLGAAALLLIVAVIGISGLGGGSGGEEAGTTAVSGGAEGEAGTKAEGSDDFEREQAGGEGGETAGADPDSGEQAEAPESVDDQSLEAGSSSGPRPEFRRTTFTTRANLNQKALAEDRLLSDYAASYQVDDAEKNEGRFLALMRKDAPSDLRGQVASCGREVRSATEEPVLVAYGARTEVKAGEGLLLSFVYSASADGPLTRYMVWTWPLGNCTSRVGYTSGAVED